MSSFISKDNMEDISDEGYSYAYSNVYKNPNFSLNYKDSLLSYFKLEEEFVTFCLYKIFQNKKFQGNRLLDIGCGPTVHRMAPASASFSEIIVSDYSEHNCENVQNWLNNQSPTENWDSLLEPSAILEGYGSRNLEKGINIINSRIREKIKRVVSCDVLQKEFVPMEIGKFDVLFSSYCLETACTTPEIYKSCIKKFEKNIIPGGGLVMVIALDGIYYYVDKNEEKILTFPISKKLVNEALKQAGLKKKHCFMMENNENDDPIGEYSGVMVVSAIKENY